MSQTEFGRRLGVSRSVINNLERGVTDPSTVFVDHMCDIYRCKKRWLETGEGEMFDAPGQADEAARMVESVGESPAMRSLLATWAQLSDENRAVFERFAADYVADYQRRRAEETTAALQRVFDDPDPCPEDSASDAV